MLWCLQAWNGTISNDVQRLIQPVTDFVLSSDYEQWQPQPLPPVEPPMPNTVPLNVHAVGRTIADHHPSKIGVVPAGEKPALLRSIAACDETPASSEIQFAQDGVTWSVQIGRSDPNTDSNDTYHYWRSGWGEAVPVPKA